MLKKTFMNRMIHERSSKIRKMKSLWIDNMDKQMINNTPHGLFALTLNPNQFVYDFELEDKFESILSHYYKWKYGTKWRDLTNIQNYFEGIIETQSDGLPHIHITIYQFNVVEVSIFVTYIKDMFKSLYHKSSHKIKKIYDIQKWAEYISTFETSKDKLKTKKRITTPLYISSELFGAKYNRSAIN